MPVLPAVPSTTLPPGRSSPRCSASADDGARRAVLDRAAGIHELGLGEDLAAGLLADSAQPDQRRIADRAGEAVCDAHKNVMLRARLGHALQAGLEALERLLLYDAGDITHEQQRRCRRIHRCAQSRRYRQVCHAPPAVWARSPGRSARRADRPGHPPACRRSVSPGNCAMAM